MRLRQRLGLRAGIGLLATGSVLLEIAIHRSVTALFGHPLALAILPLALASAGAGALLLHLAPGLARPPRLLARLGYLATLAAAGTLAALIVPLHVKVPEALGDGTLWRLGVLALALGAPFFFVGAAITAAVRYAGRDLGRLGFTILAAAALAAPLAVVALRAGATRIPLFVVILDAFAAAAFYLAARAHAEASPLPRPSGHVVATVLLASGVLLAGDLGAPWVKAPGLRWAALEKTEAQEWTAGGLVTVDKAHAGTAMIRLDGTYGTPMVDAKYTSPASPDELGYVLRRDGSPALVIGAGGGRDVRVAQKHSQKEIHVVEPNATLVRSLLRDRYKKWNGEVLDKRGVEVHVEDARGFLRRTPLRFRTIAFTLADAQAPAALGALAAEAAPLQTVDALRDALDRLTPDGVVVWSRWDVEFDRGLAIAVAALRSAGISAPAQHLYACSAARSTTLLVTRAPLTARELGQVRAHCRKNKLNEAFAPDQPHSDLRARITSEPDLLSAVAPVAADLSPPTADRPHFFASVPRRSLLAALGDLTTLRARGQALLVIVVGSVLAAVAYMLGALVPALRRPRLREIGARLSPVVFLSAAGAGLTLAQAALSRWLPLLVGHSGHALTTVHVALFGFAGAGFLLGARVPGARAMASAGYRAQSLVALLAVLALALGPIVDRGLALPLPVRLGLALAVLAPIGLLFGSLVPLAVRLTSARTPELVPWSLGAGLLAAALAALVGALLGMALGTSALLLAGGAAFLVAAVSAPRG